MIVWLNGKLIEAAEARIDPADRGFLLGDGLFETLLATHGKIIFADQHLERLAQGANVLGINIGYDAATLIGAMSSLLIANRLEGTPRTALRLTLSRGPGPRGLLPPKDTSPTVLIACFPSQAPAHSTTAITTTVRRNEFSPTSNLKALPYLDQILAKREAVAAGADDALFLNTQGKLACASAANLFLWDSNTLLTPPLSDGCLDGITRRAVIDVAQSAGIGFFEESITPATLANVEGAFLTNSLIGMMPLSAIDGRDLKEHELMQPLRAALHEAEQASLARPSPQ
ncbi:MAG: 2-keto-4-methylthiobutyrate aminotransferase [Rhodobiaceae bacterium]|nr:MAG: 2-keto-4-methylthiobutyrate aminotransferase [Rhodobiaceae bacterium]